MGWIIDNWIQNQINGATHAFLQIFVSINGISGVLLTLGITKDLIHGAQIAAFSILGAKVAVEGYIHHLLRQSGDPGSDLQQVVIGAASASGMILIGPELLTKMYHFSITLSNAVNAIGFVRLPKMTMGDLINNMIVATLKTVFGNAGLLMFLVVVAILAMLGIVFMQAFVRSGELAVAAIIVSFSALGLTHRSSSSMREWIRESWTVCATTVLHLVLIKLAMVAYLHYALSNPIYGLCFFLGLLWVAYKTPSTVRRYTHSTGIGQMSGGMLRTGSALVFRRVASIASA